MKRTVLTDWICWRCRRVTPAAATAPRTDCCRSAFLVRITAVEPEASS